MENVYEEVKKEEKIEEMKIEEEMEKDEDELSDEDDEEFVLRPKEDGKGSNSLGNVGNIKMNKEDGNILESTEQNEFSGENFVPISQFGPKLDISVFQTDIDLLEDKPWKNPDANLSDYFNYGFNEESWKIYCAKVLSLKDEYGVYIKEKDEKTTRHSKSPSPNRSSSRHQKEDKYHKDDKYSRDRSRRDSRERSSRSDSREHSSRGESRSDDRYHEKRRRDDRDDRYYESKRRY